MDRNNAYESFAKSGKAAVLSRWYFGDHYSCGDYPEWDRMVCQWPFFYFIDTHTREIRRFIWDKTAGLSKAYHTLVRVPDKLGMPDGMCMGPDGHLWVAHWNGFGIYKWHIETGELLDRVHVNAPHVTSCCFGGPTGMDLFITTAREGLDDAQLEVYPDSGKVFHFKN
ncbi:SMP-30/gluconolactonase/LRE family protein [Sphingobacterium sp. E70]|nr:SMP-30/gluconolactonase/LRE family protein [Sphingobacterium sp. E70]ULT23728.1 SMP-30/gluconolactonase/LRE family protein [Sphingobacterium sp. E70]